MQREFDDLAISLANGQSRRGTLKQLLLGAIGIPAVTLGGLGLSEAEAKKKKNKNRNKKKKVTLCQNGQTIKVNKKAKKKFLRKGATPGACQDTPSGQCQTADDCTNPITTCQERACTNGVCGVLSLSPGTACDDGNACTTDTTCDGQGACSGGTSVSCNNPPSECQTSNGATCDPGTGQCSYPDQADDTPCGMNKCDTTCQGGVCQATPVVCPGNNLCQESTCDPNTGNCSAPTPIACPAPPECKTGAGVCDPQSGNCSYTDALDDTPCGMNKCDNTCQNGQCVVEPVVCPTPSECQTSFCDANTGTCGAPIAANQGAPCDVGNGVCIDGQCLVLTTGNTCNNQSPCAEPVECGGAGSNCVCYSSVEGGNLCIRRSEATCLVSQRPTGCDDSDDCESDEVCAPLDQAGPGTICCPDRPDLAGKRGFCVPISAVCQAV